MILCHDDDSGDRIGAYQNLQYMTSFKVIVLYSKLENRIRLNCVLPCQMNALVVREISKGNGTFGFELEHDEKGPKKREGAHQVKIIVVTGNLNNQCSLYY